MQSRVPAVLLSAGCPAGPRTHSSNGCLPDSATGRERTGAGFQGEDVSKLLDLMRRLGSDAKLAAEYEKDPDAVLRRAGLSDEEREAMAGKDYEAIKRLTGLTDGQFATNHVVRAYDE